MKVSFQIKLFISLVAFFSVLFALLGGYYYADVGKQLYQEMSARAKIQAEEIALIPSLRNEVEQKDITAIHDFMQKMAAHSDASFIVIGDNTGKHLFHSVFADRVGTTLVGGDNEAVLQGKARQPSVKADWVFRCAVKPLSSTMPGRWLALFPWAISPATWIPLPSVKWSIS
jgi:two-component system cit operon sensor histidine kinase CitA